MNIPRDIKNPQYGQRSFGGSLRLCKELNFDSNNLGLLIDNLSNKFSKPLSLEDCICEDLNNVYTSENISKENREKGNRSCRIYRNNEIESNRELYQRSLIFIDDYCNETFVSDEWKFYLKLFQASLSRRLDEMVMAKQYNDIAWEIYGKEGRDWGQRVDLLRREKRLEKYDAISRGCILHLQNQSTFTFKEALLSKSFIVDTKGDGGSKDVVISGYINRLRQTPFSKKIMHVNALNALYNRRFNILFVNKKCQDTSGYMNMSNSIYIHTFGETAVPIILFHELVHKAIDDIFSNGCSPYGESDYVAEKAYHECMRQVLLNLVDAVFPIERLAKFACDRDYKWSNSGSEGVINFPHPWSRDLELGKLVENCFSSTGILEINNANYLMEGCFEENDQSRRFEYIVCLIEELRKVFTKYNVSEVDREFITYGIQSILNYGSEDRMNIISPLVKYIDEYVMPEIDEYICKHPCSDQLNDVEEEEIQALDFNKASVSNYSRFFFVLAVWMMFASYCFYYNPYVLNSIFNQLI